MKQRCLNPKMPKFKDYGGRGITVCDRWLNSPTVFVSDMGLKPGKKYSLDRIDNNGDYEPSNCRWATQIEQVRNRRDNRKLTVNGVTRLIVEWSELYSIHRETIMSRIKGGWSNIDAVSKPVRWSNRK